MPTQLLFTSNGSIFEWVDTAGNAVATATFLDGRRINADCAEQARDWLLQCWEALAPDERERLRILRAAQFDKIARSLEQPCRKVEANSP